MIHKLIFAGIGTILAAVVSTTAFTAENLPVISIDAGKTLGPVNRLVFGHNIEAADGRGIFSEAPNAANFDKSGIKYGQGLWNPVTRKPYTETAAMVKSINPGMMRYPGGCLAHNYNWKKAVGPLPERGDWQFGIDEYIKLCRELNVEPLFTVTDYALPVEELPKHAAELVEYLNAPATPDHPWAMKRKEWGNPEPYNVKWFELGNESDHGNHKCIPGRKYTPAEYIKYAGTVAAAMKAVDPSILVGVVTVPGSGADYGCPWNIAIYRGACPFADFVVVHFYGPGVDDLAPEACLSAAMAFGDQLEYRLKKYRELIKNGCGRDLPLAVTEFNIASQKDEPTYYRFSYIAGLQCADMTRLWLNPGNRIATANYWHVLNGFWGTATSSDGKITARRATLPFFELWGKHFGDELVAAAITGAPGIEAAAANGLDRSAGSRVVPSRKIADMTMDAFNLSGFSRAGMAASLSTNNELAVNFTGCGKPLYIEFSRIKRPEAGVIGAGESCRFRITFEAKFTPEPGSSGKPSVGLGMCDVRGWDKTQSAIAVTGAENARDWQPFEGNFITKPDCPGATALVRLENVNPPVSGKLEIRNLKIELFSTDIFPAYQGLTASSSLSQDGRTLYLMVFNKSIKTAIEADINVNAFDVKNVKAFELYQQDYSTRKYFTPEITEPAVRNNSLRHTFPPHSMTAFEFYRQ